MKKLPALLILSGLISSPVFAADAPAASAAKPSVPTLSDVLGASNITLTGYVDATYTAFNKAPPGGMGSEPLRQFDTRQNSFALNQAAITASMLPASGFGALINVIAGSDGKALRNSEITSGMPTNSPFDVYQAYGQYANGPLTVMAGKFATLAGAETVNPTSDSNISRSLVFTNLEPLSHTGVRAAYAPSSTVTLTAGVNNGWNYTSAPTTGAVTISGKTIELGVAATPSKMFSLSGAIYSGEAPSLKGQGRQDLYDLVATINATDALSFVLNYDYVTLNDNRATGGSTKKSGLAAYANYAFSDQWSLSLRGEYLDDKDGMITGATSNKLKEASLDLNYNPAKNATLRAEVRGDQSDKPFFGSNASAKNQSSVELEAIYKF